MSLMTISPRSPSLNGKPAFVQKEHPVFQGSVTHFQLGEILPLEDLDQENQTNADPEEFDPNTLFFYILAKI
jgi:hypothetical protein